MRKQLRPTDEKYETGDKVYYKHADSAQWKSPGVVIGQDGAVIFVRHGGTYVRVHHSRLRKTDENHTIQEYGDAKEQDIENSTVLQPAVLNRMEYDDDTDSIEKSQANVEGEIDEQNDTSTQSEDDTLTQSGEDARSCTPKLKAGQTIIFTDRESGESRTAQIVSRAGKATGKHKDWYNLQYTHPETVAGITGSADLTLVDDLQIITPVTTVQGNPHHESDVLIIEDEPFAAAKKTELDNWKSNCVFKEVKDDGQKCISTRWVCSIKETPDGIVPKARLVARGFEELNVSDIPKDSPTCASDSLRVVIAVICQRKWHLNSIDIKAAFLQGKELSRNVYIRPPPEAMCKGTLWKLNKCVYGLVDASLYWYNKVKDTMQQLGGHVSQIDPAVFYWLDDKGELTGILASHVDDFLWAGSKTFSSLVIPHLKTAFEVGRQESDSFNYVGMEISSGNGEIHVRQSTYIENLQPFVLDPTRAVQRTAPLTNLEADMMRSKIGQIQWVARQSRPDIMCDTSLLASTTKHATVQTLHDVNKLIRKLKSEEVILKFQNLGKDSSLKLVVFSDASLGNLPDGGTQGGHLIFLVGEDGKFSPISWQSKRIRRVVRSTLAGETLALADGIDNGMCISALYSKITTGNIALNNLPIICVTDNHSLFDAVKSTKSVTEKRLRLEISSIKELIHSGNIKQILWSATKQQLADSLTKKGASTLLLLKTLSEGVWEQK